jgi:hypothetical protein
MKFILYLLHVLDWASALPILPVCLTGSLFAYHRRIPDDGPYIIQEAASASVCMHLIFQLTMTAAMAFVSIVPTQSLFPYRDKDLLPCATFAGKFKARERFLEESFSPS